MTTLRDLSRHLGLSVTQVSRALNGHGDVSEATRQRVEEAAKKLKYIPNIAARRLVSGRSGVVGFVERSFEGVARDTILFETVTGLSSQFSERGIQFVLHLTPEDVSADSRSILPVYDRLSLGGSLDGFVLTGPRRNDLRIRHLLNNKIPFVVHGRSSENPDYPFFDIDNYGLAQRLTRHLIGYGHRRIALISGPETFAYTQFRLAGFKDALGEAGIAPVPFLIRHAAMTEATGMIATAQMFADPKRAPTAIICGNVLIANGAYRALAALGREVPADVSVVAHDDVVSPARTDSFYPTLTVTRSALSASWGPLADFLIGAIEGRAAGEIQEVAQVDFIERASVAAPRPE
ncbi:MAG: substrate-binding domain-containing protein [Rhodobacteraceae bacterium]|nr:substrate-binding domain-containing protein [Paracoccaceae bacterium]